MSIFSMRSLRPDLRKTPRHELHFAAYIATDDQSFHRTCIIHDISEGGARLTIGPRPDVPENFTLVFSRNCRVVRRADDSGQIAVEFLQAKS
jgi:PilZ domain